MGIYPQNLTMGRMIAATPRILPAVYDDAMTYVEQLRILNDKLNEVIDVFNKYGDELLVQSKEYTDAEIAKLNETMTETLNQFRVELDNGLADLDATLQEKLDEFEERAEAEFTWFRQRADELFEMFVEETTKLNENINRLQIAVNTLFDALGRTKLEIRQEMREELNNIVTWLQNALAYKTGEQIIVRNPITRTLTTLNVALDAIADVIKYMFSLTVDEYNSLKLTVEEYNALKLTVTDVLYKARWVFIKELYFPDLDKRFGEVYDYINHEVEVLDKNHYMVSPFTGVVTPIQNVLYDLAQLHMDGITADQYNELVMTVDAYAEKQITAYDYAWNGFFILYTGAVPKETLQEQIQELQTALAEAVQRIQNLENGATESPTISTMKAEIAKQRADFNDQIVQQEKVDIYQNKKIETNKSDIAHMNDTVIPDAINGLHDTMSTAIGGVQTQVTEINSGLASININWKTAQTFTNRKK